MEIKNKRLFTVVLAMTMIALFSAIYFAASSFFVSAATNPPTIENKDKNSYTGAAGTGIFKFTATEASFSTKTNLASDTDLASDPSLVATIPNTTLAELRRTRATAILV